MFDISNVAIIVCLRNATTHFHDNSVQWHSSRLGIQSRISYFVDVGKRICVSTILFVSKSDETKYSPTGG